MHRADPISNGRSLRGLLPEKLDSPRSRLATPSRAPASRGGPCADQAPFLRLIQISSA